MSMNYEDRIWKSTWLGYLLILRCFFFASSWVDGLIHVFLWTVMVRSMFSYRDGYCIHVFLVFAEVDGEVLGSLWSGFVCRCSLMPWSGSCSFQPSRCFGLLDGVAKCRKWQENSGWFFWQKAAGTSGSGSFERRGLVLLHAFCSCFSFSVLDGCLQRIQFYLLIIGTNMMKHWKWLSKLPEVWV